MGTALDYGQQEPGPDVEWQAQHSLALLPADRPVRFGRHPSRGLAVGSNEAVGSVRCADRLAGHSQGMRSGLFHRITFHRFSNIFCIS